MANKFWKWVLGIVNRRLKGYTVQVGKIRFHPIGLSLDLDDLVLIQNENPDPPVASIKRLHARVHWNALIRGRLVGDALIDRPKLYLAVKNATKADEEAEAPLGRKGWQDRLAAAYPVKIDVFGIRDGELTYLDQTSNQRIRAGEIFLHATNIRNVFSPENVYPSLAKLEMTLFEKGKLTLDGHVNFLQKPRVGFKGELDLRDIDVGDFSWITERENFFVRKGVLRANGNMKFAPENTDVHLKAIECKGLDADYELRPETQGKTQELVQKATKAVKEISNEPTLRIRADALKISQGTVGYVNRTTDPDVRIYANHIEASMKDFSNQLAEGLSEFQMRGQFMGSGDTRITGTFWPETKRPNLSLKIAIDNTDMKAMSEIFQAYGKFDITRGDFSFFSEMTIRNNHVQGYVKPIFKNMEVSDMRVPEQKSLLHRLYVGAVKVVTIVLMNRSRKQVATETDISGPLEDPSANIWRTVANLVRNAFIKAILPGFEREVNRERQTRIGTSPVRN